MEIKKTPKAEQKVNLAARRLRDCARVYVHRI